jgi:hypothetical protein
MLTIGTFLKSTLRIKRTYATITFGVVDKKYLPAVIPSKSNIIGKHTFTIFEHNNKPYIAINSINSINSINKTSTFTNYKIIEENNSTVISFDDVDIKFRNVILHKFRLFNSDDCSY